MTTRDELWAAVDRRKAEHAAGLPFTAPAWNDFDAAVRAAERTHLMDPETTPAATRPKDMGSDYGPTPEMEARWEFADHLRSLATFIEGTHRAPLPPGDMVRHFSDADQFDKTAAVMGSPVNEYGTGYERCTLKFGPITYGVQTDGRRAQQVKRREEAIAKRERELGLSTEDIGQAA